MIDPSNIFYVNLDDNPQGLLEKNQLGEEYGFNVISEGHLGFSSTRLVGILEELTRSGAASGTIVIVDTLKKITDLMDKRQTSLVMAAARRFTGKGGTVIGLAHVNKALDAKGRAVFAGTTDARDDADCVYMLEEAKDQPRSDEKIVEFRNIKRRGNNPHHVAYAYATEPRIPYRDLLLSVRKFEPEQLEAIAEAAEAKSDAELVEIVEQCIREGVVTQMKLATEAGKRSRTSRRIAAAVIDKYTGDNPARHRWNYSIGPRGAHVYALLPGAGADGGEAQ